MTNRTCRTKLASKGVNAPSNDGTRPRINSQKPNNVGGLESAHPGSRIGFFAGVEGARSTTQNAAENVGEHEVDELDVPGILSAILGHDNTLWSKGKQEAAEFRPIHMIRNASSEGGAINLSHRVKESPKSAQLRFSQRNFVLHD